MYAGRMLKWKIFHQEIETGIWKQKILHQETETGVWKRKIFHQETETGIWKQKIFHQPTEATICKQTQAMRQLVHCLFFIFYTHKMAQLHVQKKRNQLWWLWLIIILI